ncbi:MAG TPA: alpha/beta hydrolase [Anaerolineales bacterium]|nr:alpha/beta hydrolase [Anaerolineales bacterium]
MVNPQALPNSSYLFLNDLRVHYLRWGVPGGQPVVLLHGLASNARIWELTAPYLAQAGYDVIAPDQRGHGLTDKPDGDLGFATYTRDLLALITSLELDRPILVGHSWGASVVLEYAARFAIGPRAPAGIILVDGGIIQLNAFPGATWEEMRDRLTPPRLAGMPLEKFLNLLSRPRDSWQPDDQTLQIILGNFEIREDETIAPHLRFEQHMQIVRAMWDSNTYEYFSRLRCPTLLLPAYPAIPIPPDEQDFLSAKEAGLAEIVKSNPKIRYIWMKDSIHDIPLQHPEPLANRMIEFIQTL